MIKEIFAANQEERSYSLNSLRELDRHLQDAAASCYPEEVVRSKVEQTGIDNPNDFNGSFLFAQGDIPTHAGQVYRQVGVEAVVDLVTSGVVQNGATATGENNLRWGNKVFWHKGEEGKFINTGGRFVLVTSQEAVSNGWVPINEVQHVYVTVDGAPVDLLNTVE